MNLISLSDEAAHAEYRGGVAALGFFDGVHLGHGDIIMRAAVEAKKRRVPCGVWTISYGSSAYKGGRSAYLTSEEDRRKFLHDAGADFAAVSDFESVRDMDGESFVREILSDRLRLSAVVCGSNFRFGKGAAWDAAALKRICLENGIACEIAKSVIGDFREISSSRIRALVACGDMHGARRLLGRPFSYCLPVVHGKMLGRTLGFPTANQIIPMESAVPPPGVYAASVSFTENGSLITLPGAVNIGICPTVDTAALQKAGIPTERTLLPGAAGEGKMICETYIDGYSGDLYGKKIRVEFLSRIRGEVKFSDTDALISQIKHDAESSRNIFKKLYQT